MRVLFAGQDRFLWSECCFDMISLRENASGFFESRSAKNSSTVCVFFGVFFTQIPLYHAIFIIGCTNGYNSDYCAVLLLDLIF